MRAFVRGDIDGFLGLGLDNVVQLIIVVGLCQGPLGFPAAMVYGVLLPGIAFSMLVGNALYAREALRLATRTGRDDVCAIPYGINTPTMVAYVFLVMLPARNLAAATGATDPIRVAWQIGLVACFISGLIELVIAFVAKFIQRVTPAAAMLATLAGIGFALLSMSFLLQGFARPLVGITTLAVMLCTSFGRVRFPAGLSGIPLAILIGTLMSWITGLAPVGSAPAQPPSLNLPHFVVGDLATAFSFQTIRPYLSVILPMSLLSGLSSLQNIESAEAAGDPYPARPALIINGLGTICGALLGSPFPLTIYIGHPGWKALGARAGYSTLNGIFIALLALTGGISLISWLIPEDAGLAIVVWVGLIITVQPFTTVPPRHFITIVVGLLPALGAWVSQLAKNIIRAVGHDQSLLQPALIELFHHQNLFLDGAFSLEQGFIYTATIWSAMVYYIVERRFRLAAIWSALASMLSLVGMMHAWKFANGDTALNIPLLDWLAGEPVAGGWENLVPAWPFAVAYAFIASLLFFTHRFGIPVKTDGH
jgi:AGZA family xanthine/uracil permease-like MFS transporter